MTTNKVPDADVIAEKILQNVQAEVDRVRGLMDGKSTKIEIDVTISKEQLRQISERKHIREAFLKELKEKIIDRGFNAEIGKKSSISIINDAVNANIDVIAVNRIFPSSSEHR